MSCSSSVAVFSLAVVAVLLSTCAASDSVSTKVKAYVGETVVLPCNISIDGDILTVEWSRTGLLLEIVFLYRDGCETFEEKSPDFHFRSNLFLNQLNSGNLSLRLSELRLSDGGEYQCKMSQSRGTKLRVVETVELSMGAAAEPRLSVVSGEGETVVLQCESDCWFPEPSITFLDDQGKDLPALHPMRVQDSQGCFIVKRNVTLQTGTKRVTCRVHQPQINQTRYADINIPGTAEVYQLAWISRAGIFWIVFVVAVIACATSSVLTFVLQKHCSSCACMKSKKSSEPGSTEDETAEQTRRPAGPPGSSADVSHPIMSPSDSSPNNSPPTSQTGARDPCVSGQNPASPTRRHHGNGSRSSLVDNNGAASSDVFTEPPPGEPNPPQPRRFSDSRMRTTSFRISRTYSVSRHPTVHEDTQGLMDPEPEPETEG